MSLMPVGYMGTPNTEGLNRNLAQLTGNNVFALDIYKQSDGLNFDRYGTLHGLKAIATSSGKTFWSAKCTVHSHMNQIKMR